jgi:hypothetical protein
MSATMNQTAYMPVHAVITAPVRQNIREKRAYVLARDGYTCQYCFGESNSQNLQKHHLRAKSKGGSDDTENLITVCDVCHCLIHSNHGVLYRRPTRYLLIQILSEDDLQQAKQSVRELMYGEIRKIATKARQGKMQAVGETFFIDSAVEAYVEIEKTLRKALTNIIPWSLVFDKEDFGAFYGAHTEWLLADMAHRRYTWIIAPLVGLEAFRNPADSTYHIEVLLLKNDVPLASFAYFPEYEGDGAEGVLFEASGEEMQTNAGNIFTGRRLA